MDMRNIVLLGSSGSIGKSTLDVVRDFPDRLKIKALAVNSNIELLISQYNEFKPEFVCVVDKSLYGRLQSALSDDPVEILSGNDEMIQLSALDDVVWTFISIEPSSFTTIFIFGGDFLFLSCLFSKSFFSVVIVIPPQ